MSAKPRLLIISFTDARRDPRVYKQAFFLRDTYDIAVAGFGDPEIEGIKFIPIDHVPAKNIFMKLWRAGNLLIGNSGPFLQRFILRNKQDLTKFHFNIVLVNDVEPFPLAFSFAKKAPVVFDAHEYYPQLYNDMFWKIFHKAHNIKLCRKFIPLCSGITTVCEGIAKEYRIKFGVEPELIYNTPLYHALTSSIGHGERIRLIYHGGVAPDRGIEQMLDMMSCVDSRFTLDLMVVGNQMYIDSLKDYAKGKENIRWKKPVPMPEICSALNEYDMGLYIISPTSFNNLHSLPNKFFEFIQARLAIAIGPSPEMASIVEKHHLGVIADDFTPQSLAAKLNALTTDDVMHFKRNADNVAKLYNAEAGIPIMKEVLRRALSQSSTH